MLSANQLGWAGFASNKIPKYSGSPIKYILMHLLHN